MQRQIITVLAALVVAVPAASATWFSYGTYEPDTIQDAKSTYMFFDPPTSDTNRLYFNVYQSEFLTQTNLNVGLAGSRVQVPGLQLYMALLGNWVDCNGDDAIGLSESALWVYPTSALLDDTLCPVNTGARSHNDGQWVWEFIFTGDSHNPEDIQAHPQQIKDPEAKVWGDFGLPGAGASGTCAITPLPHGTTASSGYAIRYIDCFASKRVTGTVNTVDSDGSLGIRFDDTNNPQETDSQLNQQLPESLFGNDAQGRQETGALQLDSDEDGGDREYAFTVMDCSGQRTKVTDPTGGSLPRSLTVPETVDADGESRFTDDDGNYASVAAVSPGNVDATKSFADGANHTVNGIHVGGDEDQDATGFGGSCYADGEDGTDDDGDNSYSATHQTVFFNADGPHEGETQVANKNGNSLYFQYFDGTGCTGSIECDNDVLGSNAPDSVVTAGASSFIIGDQVWQSNIVFVTLPQSINRATLNPSAAAYATFYARVGSNTTGLGYVTPSGDGSYGAEACQGTEGDADAVPAGGWVCDPADWYVLPTGAPIQDGTEVWQGYVGIDYQFRDIDCNDGTLVRGIGVQASLVTLAPDPRPCADSDI